MFTFPILSPLVTDGAISLHFEETCFESVLWYGILTQIDLGQNNLPLQLAIFFFVYPHHFTFGREIHPAPASTRIMKITSRLYLLCSLHMSHFAST